jgi:uncharacterized membrane protein
MKKILFTIALFSLFTLQADAQSEGNFGETIRVEVQASKEYPCSQELTTATNETCTQIEVEALSGSVKGQSFTIDIAREGTIEQQNQSYEIGDRLVASYSQTIAGEDLLVILEADRLESLYLLILIFLILVVIFGRKQGFYAIIGMIMSFLILIFIVAKAILLGFNIYLVTFVSSLIIMLVTLYPTYGLKGKTHSAMIGSLLSLAITLILAFIFINLAKLTGFASDEANFLQIPGVSLDMREILFAGIVIGTLGVLDDLTIGQSSLVFEIKKANPNQNFKELYQKAITVGKDHVASMVNTLIIAYAGASFPLFLLFVQEGTDFNTILNTEKVATELVRMIVGSIGILAAVPLTTIIACYFAQKAPLEELESETHGHHHH